MPKLVEVTFSSVSPYSQSRQHDTPKLEKETWDKFEQRTWREKSTPTTKAKSLSLRWGLAGARRRR